MKSLAKLFLFVLLISACGPVTRVNTDAMPTRVPQETQDFSYQMIWSRDDSMIALTTNTGLYIYDAKTYEQLKAFDGLGGSVVAFSSKYLAAVTHKLFVWKLEDFSLLFTKLAGPDMFFHNVAISPDNKTLVTTESRQARYWSLPDGKLIGKTASVNFMLSDVAFSKNNSLIIADQYLGLILEWDVQTQKKIRAFGVSKPVANFNLSQDGKLVVVDYGDYGFETWNVDAGTMHHGYTDIISAPGANNLSGDAQTVAVWGYGVGEENGLSVWDLAKHRKISEFLIPWVNGDGWRYGALNSDGTVLAASTTEGYIYFYDLKSGEKIGEIYLPYTFKG